MQLVPATFLSLGMALIGTSYPTIAVAGPQPYRECLIASADVPEIGHGLLQGYLNKEDWPDSLQLLPAPPTLGNSDHALDNTISTEMEMQTESRVLQIDIRALMPKLSLQINEGIFYL